MSQITLLSPTPNAATVIVDASRYKFITVSADALIISPDEDVAIKMIAGGTAVVVADPTTGAAVKLKPTIPSVQLAGGVVYELTKPSTTNDCGLYMDTGPGIQS
jgi:hypothetical protein